MRTQYGNPPAKERSESRKALECGRYIRLTLLLNPGALRVEPAEVDQVSRALRPMAATHLALTFANHLSEVEPSLCPLLTLTDSPRRSIPAFRRFAGNWWLQINGGLRLRRQRAAMMDTITVLHSVAESASIRCVGAFERRFGALAVCRLCVGG